MTKFELPEINVVLFSDSEVITTSTTGGYGNNGNETFNPFAYNTIIGGSDGDFPL